MLRDVTHHTQESGLAVELARTLSHLDGHTTACVRHGHRAQGGRATISCCRLWYAQGRCVIWCEQCVDRLPDHSRSRTFEPVRPDFIHGQNGSSRIMHQDGVRNAIEEETKLCF